MNWVTADAIVIISSALVIVLLSITISIISAEKKEYVRIVRAVANLTTSSLLTIERDSHMIPHLVEENLAGLKENRKRLSLKEVREIREKLESLEGAYKF